MWQVKINKSIIIGAYHLGMRRFFMLFCLAFKQRYLLLLSYENIKIRRLKNQPSLSIQCVIIIMILFYRNYLCEVSRLINIKSLVGRNIISKQLHSTYRRNSGEVVSSIGQCKVTFNCFIFNR